MQSKLISTGLFFLFIILSGFWVSRAGKPYSVLLVTIHKLIGLAAGVYLGLTVYRVHKVTPLNTMQIVAVVMTILFFAVNVATGSLLSTNKPVPAAVSLTNKLFPYVTLVLTGVMLFLLS
jgi:hypothetical protein